MIIVLVHSSRPTRSRRRSPDTIKISPLPSTAAEAAAAVVEPGRKPAPPPPRVRVRPQWHQPVRVRDEASLFVPLRWHRDNDTRRLRATGAVRLVGSKCPGTQTDEDDDDDDRPGRVAERRRRNRLGRCQYTCGTGCRPYSHRVRVSGVLFGAFDICTKLFTFFFLLRSRIRVQLSVFLTFDKNTACKSFLVYVF